MKREWWFWIILAVVLGLILSEFKLPNQQRQLDYSSFIKEVKQGTIAEVVIEPNKITGLYATGGTFETVRPTIFDPKLIDDLLNHNVKVIGKEPEQPNFFRQLFLAIIPTLLFLAVFIWLMRQQMGAGKGGGGPFSIGKSKAKKFQENEIKITFKDVAGVDESKEELAEIVEFLKEPGKFDKLGGKIPKGVLMSGPPGTGKTLLAKAIAGEAGVPFFFISGSDFVEMFVGVGASRVRDMFDQAKKSAPCIVFIDEIDAVGRQRGSGLGGGHDEREQTLNQLLVEMDGFEANTGIIVVAATNRADVLDPALLRPGRFDRKIFMGLPDIKSREAILSVHIKKVLAGEDVNLKDIARGTPGFSGADLANLINEAALHAAKTTHKKVGMDDLEYAKDKIIMGVEKKSMMMSPHEKEVTAYHEAGHTILGMLLENHDPVYKVSIIPRGMALGVTMFLPEADKYSITKSGLMSMICSVFGGRVAEQIIYGEDSISTGAENDIQKATNLAKNMVLKWGFSDLGTINYSVDQDEVFIGKTLGHKGYTFSDKTAEKLDENIRHIVETSYQRAVSMLTANIDKLHLMAKALIKLETLDKPQLDRIMKGEDILGNT